MKKMQVLLLAAFVMLAAVAQVRDEVVRATGIATGYRAAVNEALISALEQHGGVTINATERQQMTHDDSSASTRTNGILDERAKLEMNDAITKDMQKISGGKILGYTVLSDRIENGKYRVDVDVRFKGKYVVGLNPDNRRRMAVMPFRSTRPGFEWRGQGIGIEQWKQALADKLNVGLTQTRKFTMVDRKFDDEVNAELARLTAANAAPGDMARLNQKLGTDYLIVGEISPHDVQPPAVNPFTGQVMPQPNQMFIEITYRVLLAPTGQLKWTDVVRLDAAAFNISDIPAFIAATTEAAAVQIADGLMANILPFEIVGKTSGGQLVIGEGGKSLKAGEFFTVFALGETVTDTRTGEVLDEIEDAVGTVQIIRVTDKLSYAKAVEGDPAKMVVGSRLRRMPQAAPPVPPPPPVSVVPTATGGVIAPF